MKRFISLFLALIMCLSVASCSGDDDKTEDKKDKEKIEKEEKDEGEENAEPSEEYNAAVALLDEGKVKEAYMALYACGNDAHAKALMEKFKVVHTKEETEGGEERKIEYSEKGFKTKESIYYDGRLESVCTYEYDGEGRCVKEKLTFNGQGTRQYTYYEYNSSGLLSKMKIEYGGSVSESEYFYDEHGTRVKQVNRDPSGGEYITEFEYDKSGNLIEEVMTSGGMAVSSITYECDGEGRVTKRTVMNARYGITEVFEMTYNTDGKLAITSYSSGGVKQYDIVNFYNKEHGGLTSVERHYPDGKKEQIKDFNGFEFYYAG